MGPAPSSLLLLLLAALLAALALALLFFALRGRIVAHGSFCRTCKFDLAGRRTTPAPTPTPDTTADLCPECGSNLAAHNAVRPTLRRTRRGTLVVAALLLLISLAGFSFYLSANRPNVIAYLPTWYLAAQARSTQNNTAAKSIAELTSRLQNGSLSPTRVAALIDRGLAFQADPGQSWVPEWGDFILAARNRSLATDAQYITFVKNGVKLTLVSRDTARTGEPYQLRIDMSASRLGTMSSSVFLECKCIEASAGDKKILSGGPRWSGNVSSGGSSSSTTSATLDAPVGETTVRLKVDVTAATSYASLPSGISWIETFTAPVKVVPPGTPLVEVITDETIRPTIQAALTLERAEAYPATGPSGEDLGPQFFATTYFNMKGSPVDLAYDILWKYKTADGVEHNDNLGSLIVVAGAGGSIGIGSPTIPTALPVGIVEITLRPNLSLAEGHPKLRQMWDHALVFRNVPVRNPNSRGLVGPSAGAEITAGPPDQKSKDQQPKDQPAPAADRPSDAGALKAPKK